MDRPVAPPACSGGAQRRRPPVERERRASRGGRIAPGGSGDDRVPVSRPINENRRFRVFSTPWNRVSDTFNPGEGLSNRAPAGGCGGSRGGYSKMDSQRFVLVRRGGPHVAVAVASLARNSRAPAGRSIVSLPPVIRRGRPTPLAARSGSARRAFL